MVAIARRVLGVCLVLAGIFCLCWPGVGVWRLQLKDYGIDYMERAEYLSRPSAKPLASGEQPLLTSGARAPGLDQYIQKKAGRRIWEVAGPAWEALFQRTIRSDRYLYLPAGTQPLGEILEQSGRTIFDLQLPGKYPVFLQAVLDSTHSAMFNDDIPWGMTHPWAWLTPWLIGIGILFYIFLPRPRRGETAQLRYHLIRSQIGPDILAVVLAGFFLVLPLFIITQISNHPRPLSMEGGRVLLTLICWFIALLSGTNLAVSTWYECLYFQINPIGITKVNLFGAKEYPFDQMVEIRPHVWRPPAWLRRLAWLMVLVNPGLAGPVILGSQATAPAAEVPCRDGRSLTIFVKHLVGWERLEQALLDSGLAYVAQEKQEENGKSVT